MLLFLPLLLMTIEGQILKKVSNCLDSCQSCEIYKPWSCLSSEQVPTCQEGYFFNETIQKCDIKSAYKSAFANLQFTSVLLPSDPMTTSTTWKQGKVQQCSYTDEHNALHFVSVIGMFRQIYSISKQFDVSENHQVYLFSFNLVRSSWMPHNDFLIVDFEAGTQLLGSYEISYDSREGFDQWSYMMCNGQEVLTQKFSIKVMPKYSHPINKIKVTFTGFLFTSAWGITNVKFIPGCQRGTVYNRLSQNCDFCDLGYFAVYDKNDKSQLLQCAKCPSECGKCLNQTFCTSCAKGYKLMANYTCAINQDFSLMQINEYINAQQKTCKVMGQKFKMNLQGDSIKSQTYKNPLGKPFNTFFIVFEFFYNSKFVFNNITVDISLNDEKIKSISKLNLTNKGFKACSVGSSQRYSMQKFTVLVENFNQTQISVEFVRSNVCEQCKFGLGRFNLFYVDTGSISHEQLQNLKFFASQKEAEISINISDNQIIQSEHQEIIETPNQNTEHMPQKVPTINQTNTPQKVKQQTLAPQKIPDQTPKNDKHPIAPKKQNISSIDHLAFSKNGNNGLVIRFNKTTINQIKQNSTLIMQLSSTSKFQTKKNQVQTVLYKSIAQPFMLVGSDNDPNHLFLKDNTQKEQETNKQTVVFFTDKTYLSDYVTVFQVINGQKTKLTSFSIQRTDFLQSDSQQVLSAFQNIFTALAWFYIFFLIVGLITGKLYLLQQSIQTAQVVFLGIYVFTSYLPASIVNTLSGLRRLENFDIFIKNHIDAIQRLFLGNLVQDGPLRFTLFHLDINFIRAILPLFFIIVLVSFWFLAIILYCKYFKKQTNNDQNNFLVNGQNLLSSLPSSNDSIKYTTMFSQQVMEKINSNKLDYWLQVFRILYLPIIFLAFKQFNNFTYPEDNSGEVFNTLFCLLIFMVTILGIGSHILYCSRQYYKVQYETFVNAYPCIYYNKIPTQCLPTSHHLYIYPLIKQTKIFFFTLLVALLGGDYVVIIFILMTIFYAAQVFYAWFFDIYQDSLHFKFLFVESLLLGVLLLIQLIISFISGVILTGGYLAFGFVYMAIALGVLINGLVRSTYLIFSYLQKYRIHEKDNLGTIRSQRIV